MKNWDKFLYQLILKINLFLLVFVLLLFPLKTTLTLNFITLKLLIALTISLISIIFFAVIISVFNIRSKKKLLFPNISYFLFYHIFFPIIHKLFSSQSSAYEKYSTLLIAANNKIQSKQIKKFRNDEILILLPHCLQNVNCPHKITFDIDNCQECGRCVIQDLKRLKKEFNVNIQVATGGTLARKIVSDANPKVILAVACHRDLTEGIKDIEIIPVIGVLNERPNGPCFNTTCDVNKIRDILTKLL